MNATDGVLNMYVWPTYIGLATQNEDTLPTDRRTQIQWRVGETITGSALCWAPKGRYDRFLFFNTPDGPSCSYMPLAHPFHQPLDAWVPVDPIECRDPVVAEMGAVER